MRPSHQNTPTHTQRHKHHATHNRTTHIFKHGASGWMVREGNSAGVVVDWYKDHLIHSVSQLHPPLQLWHNDHHHHGRKSPTMPKLTPRPPPPTPISTPCTTSSWSASPSACGSQAVRCAFDARLTTQTAGGPLHSPWRSARLSGMRRIRLLGRRLRPTSPPSARRQPPRWRRKRRRTPMMSEGGVTAVQERDVELCCLMSPHCP